jgi:hypothetical protein
MSAFERTSDKHHKLAGSPDERRRRRDPGNGLTLRNPVAGQVVDISAGGLGIESPRPLNLHVEYPFTLYMGDSKTRVRGEVRWCKLVGTSPPESGEPAPIYRTGIAILDS